MLCGHAPFAAHENVSREEEKKAILYKVRGDLYYVYDVTQAASDMLVNCLCFCKWPSSLKRAEGIWFLLSFQDPEYPSGLSYDAVSFMMQALDKNRQKRPSIAQLQAHPWFDSLPSERRAEQ